jgi:hypothetical protein
LITAATLLAGALGAFGAITSYQVSSAYAEKFPDAYGANRAQIRFAPLTVRIPESATVGYITDLEPSQAAYAPAYLAAQYALAPRILLPNASSRPEWAAGNFSKPMDFAAEGKAHGYDFAADLGNGVVLFHRKTN